jgi:hypothetical protein
MQVCDAESMGGTAQASSAAGEVCDAVSIGGTARASRQSMLMFLRL